LARSEKRNHRRSDASFFRGRELAASFHTASTHCGLRAQRSVRLKADVHRFGWFPPRSAVRQAVSHQRRRTLPRRRRSLLARSAVSSVWRSLRSTTVSSSVSSLAESSRTRLAGSGRRQASDFIPIRSKTRTGHDRNLASAAPAPAVACAVRHAQAATHLQTTFIAAQCLRHETWHHSHWPGQREGRPTNELCMTGGH
jgi:hypothetical protein